MITYNINGGGKMREYKSCAFIGHRNCKITKELKNEVVFIIEELINKEGVLNFLFGSKSRFNDFCHEVVTEFMPKYTNIKRVFYTCSSESCILEKDRSRMENAYFLASGKNIKLLGFEEEVEHKNKYVANVASYIERNYAMIDDCDFVVFYYDKNYDVDTSNSGTRLAYKYAKKKRKNIINVF